MKTKLYLTKVAFTSLFIFLIGMGISGPTFAGLCPATETILSSNPDSANFATYLSPQGPGWHSSHIPLIDLSDAKFDSVYTDNYKMYCAYDIPTGYLIMYPDDHEIIDLDTVKDDYKWYCAPAQSEVYPNRVEQTCVCTESRDACGFDLLAPEPYLYSYPTNTEIIQNVPENIPYP